MLAMGSLAGHFSSERDWAAKYWVILLLSELNISLEGQSSPDLGFSSKWAIAGPSGKGNNEDALETKKFAMHNSGMVSALRLGPGPVSPVEDWVGTASGEDSISL